MIEPEDHGQAAPEWLGSSADTQTMLLAVATAARTFLLSHWPRWHEKWGPPAPFTLSQWTCVRSSLLLARALERRGIRAALRSGQPHHHQGFGLLTVDGWVSHAWVEAEGFVVDITADQFGNPPVVVTPVDHPIYRGAEDEAHQLRPTRTAVAAVDEIWLSWCRYADQQR
ncbi:hypothetical protein DK412_23150 [Methylobacterium sp. 17Sr1-1]|nr:hypothetical protein DK412_23150 [Methylobacterium sp. 17Sr1-1]